LGAGAFGCVYRVRKITRSATNNIEQNREFALKEVNLLIFIQSKSDKWKSILKLKFFHLSGFFTVSNIFEIFTDIYASINS
jgi:hypothetical protein